MLHIGAPKTGTSYLQDLMNANTEELRRHGLLVAGTKRAQRQASWDLMGQTSGPLARRGAWDELSSTMAAWPGTSVLSNESLGVGMNQSSRHRFIEAFPEHEIHVVLTVRDLTRQLTATWQEALKNRSTITFADYYALVSGRRRARPSDFLRTNWLSQDAYAVLKPWTRLLPTSRITVVTVPGKGAPSGLLWERFAAVLGVADVRLTGTAGSNASLDATEAAVIRRLNSALAEQQPSIRFPAYWKYVKYLISNEILPQRKQRRSIWLTPDQAAWARSQSSRMASDLATAGFGIVGSLSDLTPDRSPVPISGDDVDAPDPQAERDASIHALAGLIAHVAAQSRS